jgi:ParB family chromosome partitioning protein
LLDRQIALIAHCVGLTVDAVQRPHERHFAGEHADTLAQALALDMRHYWTPTAEGYFERVSKAMIVRAVKEGVSPDASKRFADGKKADMAAKAEALLVQTAWLPAILRSKTTMPVANEDAVVQAAE